MLISKNDKYTFFAKKIMLDNCLARQQPLSKSLWSIYAEQVGKETWKKLDN